MRKAERYAHSTKVHADSSNFNAGVSKSDAYKHVLEQAEALFDGQDNWVSLNES